MTMPLPTDRNAAIYADLFRRETKLHDFLQKQCKLGKTNYFIIV